jgi:hypothetical protein
MEVTSRTVSRNRCGICRQEGHNRTRCPHDSATAASLAVAFNQARAAERRETRLLLEQERAAVRASARAAEPEWRAEVYAQVVDMRRRLAALCASPTVREVKIQEILFDRCQEIPEGLYKELMDALVLRD